MVRYDVYGVGNALVDLIASVGEGFISGREMRKGLMTLVSLPEQQQLLGDLKEGGYDITKRSGGSAANTLVSMAQWGSTCRYACQVSDDALGRFYVKDLKEAGVEAPKAVVKSDRATGACVVLVTPDGERTMLTHLGATSRFSAGNLDEDVLSRARCVYLEGYLSTSQEGFEVLLKAKSMAKRHGVVVALSLSDPSVVEVFSDRFHMLLSEGGVDLLFCNNEELLALTGKAHLSDAFHVASSWSKVLAATLGKEGSWVMSEGKIYAIPPYPARVVDTNGAGDVYAGGFLHAYLEGRRVQETGTFASQAASVVVGKLGPRLDEKQALQLKESCLRAS